MRKIIYRGKDIDTDEWVFGSLLQWTDGKTEILTNEDNDELDKITVYPETVGQFTGLTDKNGKEIFEGDIIQHGYISYQYAIEYINSGFMCCKRPREVSFSLFEADLHKVIGNIHDNPNLLTEK